MSLLIQRLDGFCPSAATWLGAMAESRADLLDLLQDLTQAELHARIAPGAHSIAEMLWHLANVELWWIACVAQGRELEGETRDRFGLTQPGELNGPPAEWDLAQFLALMDEAHAVTLQVFSEYDEEAFTTATCQRPGGRGAVSPEWIAFNLLDHLANHRGQIAMVKRLLRTAGDHVGG